MDLIIRMTDIQASVGIVQLSKLENLLAFRQKWAQLYLTELRNVSWLNLPHIPEHFYHAWQSFVCVIDETQSPLSRNDIMEKLKENGISTRPGTHASSYVGIL